MNAPPPKLTTTDLITQFIKLRDKCDEIEKAAAEQLAVTVGPYKAAMQAIEGVLTNELLALGPDEGKRNISTPAGVCFRQKWTSAKVADREAFLDFVVNTESLQFLTNHVVKEAVLEHMETHNGMTPPGVGFEAGYKTMIRRKT